MTAATDPDGLRAVRATAIAPTVEERLRTRVLALLTEDSAAGGSGMVTRAISYRIRGQRRPTGALQGALEGLSDEGLIVGVPVVYRGLSGVLWTLADDGPAIAHRSQ